MSRLLKTYDRTATILILSLFLVSISTACVANYNDVVLDNKDHGLPCEQLPSAESVDQIIAKHKDSVEQILGVNPGYVFFDADREVCPGNADIVISFATHSDREKIETMLQDGKFFGVPVRLRNQ